MDSFFGEKPTCKSLVYASALGILMMVLGACASPDPSAPADAVSILETRIDSLEKIRRSTRVTNEAFDQLYQQTQLDLAEAYKSQARNIGDTEPEKAAKSLLKAASIYQNNLVDMEQALDVFDQIISRFPDTETGITSLFHKGFIIHNDLGDTLQAKEIFSAFLAKYPEHHLADDARFELDHLGVPAKDLLETQQEASSGDAQAAPPSGNP